VTPVRTAFALALCGLACAIPPASHESPRTPSEACAQPRDIAIVVVSEPSGDDERDVDACVSFCAELGSTCPGTLTGGEPCIAACTEWAEPALQCREEWLADGSCIGAALDSPTCAT
jgi:hypothetical protein